MHAWRRERASGWEDSLGNRGGSPENRGRLSGESGRFSRESRRMTKCRTYLFYREFFVLRFASLFASLSYIPVTAVLQCDYSNPDWAWSAAGADGEANARHSGSYGRRASWKHGDWRPRRALGLQRPQPQQARCPPCRSSNVTEPCPASSGRGTRPPGNLTDSGRRLSVEYPAHLQEHFPDRRALPGRREANGSDRGDARRGDTRHDTRSTFTVGGGADVPDIPEFVSEQGGAAMPRQHARHALAGVEALDVFDGDTGVPESLDAAGRGPDRLERQEGNMGAGLDGAELQMGCRASHPAQAR